jgi:hypothetical protein
LSERQQQITVVEWWRWQHPKYEKCLFSIPNGTFLHGNEKQRCRQMSALKAEGLRPGVSDLFLMVARGGYNGLFIEMKDVKKTRCHVTEEQLEHLKRAKEQGYAAEWAAGADVAIKMIDKYMNLENL